MNYTKQLGDQSQALFQQGMPYVSQVGGYYQSLLNGSRGALGQAIQPQVSALRDVYAGANRGIEQQGIRGGAADYARSNLNRQMAGQIGDLIPQARAGAAQNLGALGANLVSGATTAANAGSNAAQGAGSIYGNLLGQQTAQGNVQYQRDQAMGQSIMNILAPLLLQSGKKGGGGGADLAPYLSYIMNMVTPGTGNTFGGGQ
jgi:hypothetical protein